MPGTIEKAAAPKMIRSADAAGSRPEKSRGTQKAAMMAMPNVASATWYGSKPNKGSDDKAKVSGHAPPTHVTVRVS